MKNRDELLVNALEGIKARLGPGTIVNIKLQKRKGYYSWEIDVEGCERTALLMNEIDKLDQAIRQVVNSRGD